MKTKIYLILFFAFPFISCNSWLDVTPQGQVEASDMLSSEKGYNSALGGVYYTLSSSTLYGKELSYGLMDLLAQYWITKMLIQWLNSMQYGKNFIPVSHNAI
ncbi:MAG: hypothetical protein RR397_10330 [Odoribacter sp.]